MAFGDIKIVDEATHHLLDGRRIWVTHGDLFDGIIQHAKWLAYLGDSMYTVILKLNNWFNHFRHKFGLSYWSLSQYLKHKVKNAVSFITNFENIMTDEARRRGYDGVLCGHIHKAEIRDIDGILYSLKRQRACSRSCIGPIEPVRLLTSKKTLLCQRSQST
jgi:UDP-2,3-diacylglucosamine pyrophosphatase LpxH